MALTPLSLAPAITSAFATFFGSKTGGPGVGQIDADMIAHADGASVGDLFIVTAGPAVSRLAIGSTGQIPIVSGGTLAYTSALAYQRVSQSVVSSPVSMSACQPANSASTDVVMTPFPL